jgi:hypothetical protein
MLVRDLAAVVGGLCVAGDRVRRFFAAGERRGLLAS